MFQGFNDMETILTELQIKRLREKGVISKNEIAYLAGDLIVAEDVVTRQRRVVSQTPGDLLSEAESSRRLLKG